jgi:REP element-mobilizing transposase RayT
MSIRRAVPRLRAWRASLARRSLWPSRMATPPRNLQPGDTRLVTRRTSERRFFLAPLDETTQQIFLYVLGLCLRRRRFELHAFCLMSNHYHLVGTDLDGNLPDFTRDLNSQLALVLNSRLDRRESLWTRDPASYVHLLDADDIFEKIVYTLTNPVSAELVASHEKWPGALSPIDRIGAQRAMVVRRPEGYFDPEIHPESIEIRLTVPHACRSETPATFRARLREEVRAREESIRETMRREGRKFLGVERLRGARYRPTTHSAAHDRKERDRQDGKKGSHAGKHPTLAAHDRWRRIEALQRHKGFLKAYREALEKFTERLRAGKSTRNIEFPHGTYLLRVRYGVSCQGGCG